MTGKDIAKITLNLVVIYLVGGLILAAAYGKTSPIIYRIMEDEKEQALKRMMPLHLKVAASGPVADKIKSALPEGAAVREEGGSMDAEVDLYDKEIVKLRKAMNKAGVKEIQEYSDYLPVKAGKWEPAHKHAEYYTVAKGGENAAYMVESYGKGYSSYIHILAAVDRDFTVMKVNVLGHSETPGLGDEVETVRFKDQYRGKTLDKLEVIKGPTDDKIQAITGATISSRAVTRAVREGVEMLKKTYGEAGGGLGQAHAAAPTGEAGEEGVH